MFGETGAGWDRSVWAISFDNWEAMTSMPTVPPARIATKTVVGILARRFPMTVCLTIGTTLSHQSVINIDSA